MTNRLRSPHISLTKLDRDDQAEAAAIGRRTLATTSSTRSQALELCNIGENNERWEILASCPAATARGGRVAPELPGVGSGPQRDREAYVIFAAFVAQIPG